MSDLRLIMETKRLVEALIGCESEYVCFEDEEGYSYFAAGVRPERPDERPADSTSSGCVVRLYKP